MYAEYNWEYNKTQPELEKALYTVCLKAADDLFKTSPKNSETSSVRLEADPATIILLQLLDEFNITTQEYRSATACWQIGTLGSLFEVWRNWTSPCNYILITHNGNVARINILGLV